jgi:hypothetical protein
VDPFKNQSVDMCATAASAELRWFVMGGALTFSVTVMGDDVYPEEGWALP